MSKRNFLMRLNCTYSGSGNDVATLDVEHRVNGQWETFDLKVTSPGFEIFVYSIFTCQHMYMRVNCAERGLQLGSSEGSIAVGADEGWNLETLEVDFTATLSSGHVDQEHTDYIISRMRQCPVSRNIRDIPDIQTRIAFNQPG